MKSNIDFDFSKISQISERDYPIVMDNENVIFEKVVKGNVDRFSLSLNGKTFSFPVDPDFLLFIQIYYYVEGCLQKEKDQFKFDFFLDQGVFLIGIELDGSSIRVSVGLDGGDGCKTLFENECNVLDFLGYWRSFLNELKIPMVH